MYEPYCHELLRRRVVERGVLGSRLFFWVWVMAGLGLAVAYSTPYYVKGPQQATRVCGVSVVFLAAVLLGAVALVRECAYLGLALALTQ